MSYQHNPRTKIVVRGNTFKKYSLLEDSLNEMYVYSILTNQYIVNPKKIKILQNGEVLRVMMAFEHYSQCCHTETLQHDLIEALYALEMAGIIHNDLKLTNIVYDAKHGRHKLIDFGNAQTIDCSENSIGSWYISSPEVLLLNSEVERFAYATTSKRAELLSNITDYVSPQSDMWSLGCVLYQNITGRYLLSSPDDVIPESAYEALNNILNFQTIWKKEWRQRLLFLDPKIRKCMNLDADLRPWASDLIGYEPEVLVNKCDVVVLDTPEYREAVDRLWNITETDNGSDAAAALIQNYWGRKNDGIFALTRELFYAANWLTGTVCEKADSMSEFVENNELDSVRFASVVKDVLEVVNYCFYYF
jgi:serine/threonine protein kinase